MSESGSFGSRRGLVPNRASRHKCPRDGCQVQVPSNLAFCRVDWGRLPKPLRDEVWAAYDNGQGQGTRRHLVALAEAKRFLDGLDMPTGAPAAASGGE